MSADERSWNRSWAISWTVQITHQRYQCSSALMKNVHEHYHERSWAVSLLSAHDLYRSWAFIINFYKWALMSNTAYEWLLAISLIRCVNVNSPRGTKGVVMCPNGFIINNEQIPLGHSHTKTFIEKLYLSLYHVLPPIHLLVVVYSSYQSYIPSLV